MRKKARRPVSAALAVLIAIIALGAAASPALAAREVRVGTWSYPPQVSLDAQGHPVGIFIDIVEAANEQLESFSYSVSHDLRAPLRALDGFSLALLEDSAERLDEEGKEHLGRIRRASQRMAELIDALLNLSHLGRIDMELTDVDLSVMAARVAAELAVEAPERDVEWTIEKGLTAHADAALADVVLENLLGNAWKFTKERFPAHIEFGASERDGESVFYVRDDDAGFDDTYVDKLFKLFERLHTSDQFSGTGIGLATVRRAVTRHGGHCWAESSPGEGATFFFTL